MRMLRIIFLILLPLGVIAGCARFDEPDYRETDYGYVQFKLYKEASYEATKAADNRLEYLKDVSKIRVTLKYEGNLITQTLVLSASNDEAAEYGLRSDKLKLLAGTYDVLTFSLYDKQDVAVYEATPSAGHSSFEVQPGGLSVHDLVADVVARGKVRFTIVKDMSDFDSNPATKVPTRAYTFDEIESISVTVRSEEGVKTVFEKLPAEFSVHFDETDEEEDGYQTSSMICDTLLSLRAGRYVIESFVAYDKSSNLLEESSRVDSEFVVEDNQTTDADVPVRLYESDEYIKDYYALYEIWKSLHGEDWRYVGEDYTPGSNWDFNKDPDLWGDQPGVSLHSNGRVALINISGFGFYLHRAHFEA